MQISIYVPFGLISDYEKSFQGSSHGLYSKVQVISVQPTLSYKITDRIAVGFGPTLNKIDGKLTNTLQTTNVGAPRDAKITIKGDDTAIGYNLGLMVDLSEQTTWGITYHSKVDYTLKGHTKVHDASTVLPGIDGKYKASLDFTTPESIDTSITHKLDDQWTLHGGLTWTRWSRLESIEAKNKGVAFAQFSNLKEELNWHNTWAYSIGASYQVNPEWVLRTGFALDQSPTTNQNRTVRIPVGHRKILTFGAGWKASDNLTLDLAYAYIHENSAGVNSDGDALNIKPAYSAKYRNNAHGVTGQATWNF